MSWVPGQRGFEGNEKAKIRTGKEWGPETDCRTEKTVEDMSSIRDP